MVNCDSCDRHLHNLLLKRIRYRIEGSGSAAVVHAYVFCMRYKSSRNTWKIASSGALLELLSHSSFLCAFFSNTVRPWWLCASLKSRRRHPTYCVRCTFRTSTRTIFMYYRPTFLTGINSEVDWI